MRDRGRLIDAIVDVQFKIAQKRAAIHADPDVASGMARFVHELGMTPVDHCDRNREQGVCCGCAGGRKPDRAWDRDIISGCDLYDLHEAVKAVGVDLVRGTRMGITSLMMRGSPSHESVPGV